jgi:formate hydrogenlyase transcriptional activator
MQYQQTKLTMKRKIDNKGTLIREQEMELLLSISADLVTVRDSDGLLRVVTVKLKDLIGFDHIHICTLSPDRKSFGSFISDSVSRKTAASMGLEFLPVNDGFTDKSLMSASPLCLDLDSLKDDPKIPGHYKQVYDSGIRQVVINRLGTADGPLGFWFLLFTHSDPVEHNSLKLIGGISHHISSAVSNIISNREISRREEEKTSILEFSNAIASVRDRDVLGRIVQQQLWHILGISHYCIWLNSSEKNERIAYLYDKDTPIAKSPLFQQGLQIFTSSEDYLFQQSLAGDEVTMIEEKDWQRPEQPAYIYGVYAREFNVRGFGASRLRLAGEDLAVMVFSHDQLDHVRNRMPLYRSICSQLAIVLSNMLGTEKINQQLTQINSYKEQLEVEKTYLQEEIASGHSTSGMIGKSSLIREMLAMIDKVSNSASTVLILGETGTGKELVARTIHNSSPRKDKLMVKVNCAALPPNLIESELFGHERGSFTGAHDRRLGKFELADKGTLFLDEIGELPLELQAKLLRVLQEKEIERIGGKSPISVDVRIIAATNRDLEREIRKGRFREDLYYRLNIFPIPVPPLKERSEDIPLLTEHFLSKFTKQAGKKITGVSKATMKEMTAYPWPGNIRELEHFIERSVLLADGELITNAPIISAPKPEKPTEKKEFRTKTIDDNERELIVNTLNHCGGQIAGIYGAAKLLGVPPTTLHSKMKKLGIIKRHG